MIRDKIRENVNIDFNKDKISIRKSVAILVTAVLLSSVYLVFAFNRYERIAGEEAIVLANSLEAMIHENHVESLKGDETDISNPDYITT